MPFRRNRGRISWKDHNTARDCPPRPQNSKIPSKRAIPEIKETSAKIHRLCQLLPQLQPPVVRKITWFLRTAESRQTDQSNRRLARQLQSEQRSISGSLQIGSQTTNHRTPIRPNDGCQLQRQKTQLKKKLEPQSHSD